MSVGWAQKVPALRRKTEFRLMMSGMVLIINLASFRGCAAEPGIHRRRALLIWRRRRLWILGSPSAPRNEDAVSHPDHDRSTRPGKGAEVAFGAWLLVGIMTTASATEIPPAERRSGYDTMGAETQAMQRDDTTNPGMLWVQDGADLWEKVPSQAKLACAGCHGDATQAMRGVAARYPAFDERSGGPIDLETRINRCRTDNQSEAPYAQESRELLAVMAYVATQSRGLPITPVPDPRLGAARERGRALFTARMGQLGLTCAACHDDNHGHKLGAATIPQGHPNGYPLYRLEWQGLGSVQRRLRNCMTGMRAEPFAAGSSEALDLELYLMSRAAPLPIETPAVRP